MKVAVTGPSGRLGSAVVRALRTSGERETVAWGRPDYDIDEPWAATRVLARDRPDVVVHTAAWTDVDGCARDPRRALRRNGDAVRELAEACVRASIRMILVSTNEVFDGRRTDGRGYATTDEPLPPNAYGASKLAGEMAALASFAECAGHLAIVRTSWLYGPPGNDFPSKILAAAERAQAAGEPLRLVRDEFGIPCYAPDVAGVIVALLASQAAGIFHAVGQERASRAEWAEHVLDVTGVSVETRLVSFALWQRDSRAPAWAVLAPALPSGARLRGWREATADYVNSLAVATAC